MNILLLNGPNLSLLGKREDSHYGKKTLQEIVDELTVMASSLGASLSHIQSNHEGALIDAIHSSFTTASGILINAGAYSHTSIAIMDALKMFKGPIVEVHLSNIHSREQFRRHSYVSEVATGMVCGFKEKSYELALRAIVSLLT